MCTITQQPYIDLLQPVLVVGDQGRWHIFEFDALRTWWLLRGTHPALPNTPLPREQMRRLVVSLAIRGDGDMA